MCVWGGGGGEGRGGGFDSTSGLERSLGVFFFFFLPLLNPHSYFIISPAGCVHEVKFVGAAF